MHADSRYCFHEVADDVIDQKDLTSIQYTCKLYLSCEWIIFLMPQDGDLLLEILGALANPHRLRIVAELTAHGRNYVSELARQVGISRPLLHLHLQKLEAAGLVTSKLEISSDGKALNYFSVTDFKVHLSPTAIVAAAKSLTAFPATQD